MSNITAKKLNEFFSQFKLQKYKKGELIVKGNTSPTGIYFLKKGVVKIYSISSSGEEIILNIFKQGAYFPLDTVFTNTKVSRFYYEAMSTCEVYKSPKDSFEEFTASEPSVLSELLQRIYRGLDGFYSRVENLMSGSACKKLMAELSIYARRFGEKNDQGTVIKVKLTQKDIASQTGISRETVNREMQTLKQRGLIDYQKKQIVIKDMDMFQSELTDTSLKVILFFVLIKIFQFTSTISSFYLMSS